MQKDFCEGSSHGLSLIHIWPIADCALCVLAGLLHGLNAGLQVPNIIQCVEDAEDAVSYTHLDVYKRQDR